MNTDATTGDESAPSVNHVPESNAIRSPKDRVERGSIAEQSLIGDDTSEWSWEAFEKSDEAGRAWADIQLDGDWDEDEDEEFEDDDDELYPDDSDEDDDEFDDFDDDDDADEEDDDAD